TEQLTLFTLVFNILNIKHNGKTEAEDVAVTWDNVHEHLFDVVAHFLKFNKDKPDNMYAETLESVMYIKNITINGNKYTLKLPEYDLSKLKNCTVADDMEQKSADAFVTVFRYIERILKENSVEKNDKGEFTSNLDESTFITKLIYDLVGGDEKDTYQTIKPYLQNVFGAKNDVLLVTVIRLFENLATSELSQLYDTVEKIEKHWSDKLALKSDTADVNYKDLLVEDVVDAINTVKDSVDNAIEAYGNGFKLENLTTDYIYKDSIPYLLASIIFPLGDNNILEAILKIFGVNVSRDFIITELEKNGYVDMAALIKEADKRIEESDGNLNLANAIQWKVQDTVKKDDGTPVIDEETGKPVLAVDENGNPKMILNPDIQKLWYVESKSGFVNNVWKKAPNSNRPLDQLDENYRFKRALVTVLAPFRDFLGVFFANRSVVIFDDPHVNADGSQMDGHPDVVLMGERGYSNAIRPLLVALGFDAVPAQTYLDYIDIDDDYILYGIIDPILARVDAILADPIREVLDTLNSLAVYIGNGGLQETIKNLLYPITKILSPIVRLLLGEVVSENQMDMRTMTKFYDLIIGFVAEFFDIEALQLTEEQKANDFSIWDNLHNWNYLRELVDRVLSMLNVKTTVIRIDDNYNVLSNNSTDGKLVKVTAVTEIKNGKEVITGYKYTYTVVENNENVKKTIEVTTKQVTKVLGIEINGVVYPITIPKEGPFDKLASCGNLDAKTQKAVADAQAALDALLSTAEIKAAEKAVADAQAARNARDEIATAEEIEAAKQAIADAQAALDVLLAASDIKAAEEALADAQTAATEEVRANTLLAFVQYVWYVVEQNEPKLITPLLQNLLGANYDKFSKYINRVLGAEGAKPEDISTALVKLLNAIDSSDHNATGWEILKNSLVATDVKYPAGGYTSNDVNIAVQTLSDILTGVLENFLGTSITELTTEKIYTNDIVNVLAKAIYPAVAGMESTLKLAGIDVSKANIAKLIGEMGYTDIANAISNAPEPNANKNQKTWADTIPWVALDWKVNNNSDNFAHAIAAVLAPFNSLISAFLCAGKVDIASVLTIQGANGYKNALQPLLNELGFVTTGIIDEENPTLEGIIKVVLHKIDDIVTDENLVGKVIDILPGLANFVTNGGVQKFVEELIYPITNLIDPIFRLVADSEDQTIFDFAINLLAELDVIDLTDYGWKDVHKQLFTIVESLIKVNYTVVEKKNVAVSKDENGYYYTVDNKRHDVDEDEVKSMQGIAINGTAYPLTIP
ncbi:MAG: hypothetical protein K2F65_02745, partial [Eubacterium sp.]|nr:hypothetical protein [Eubacterium sp.]